MSLVAVVKRTGDRSGELPETRVVPVGMAENTAFGAYFAKDVMADAFMGMPSRASRTTVMRAIGAPAPAPPIPSAAPPAGPRPRFRAMLDTALESFGQFALLHDKPTILDSPRQTETSEEILLDLASRMDSDGGMPGKDPSSRAVATIVALMAFVSQGHTPTAGAFRSHVARLARFLKSLSGLSSRQQQLATAVVEKAEKGAAPAGDWLGLAVMPGDHWKKVMELVAPRMA
jgi:hypothetical protein